MVIAVLEMVSHFNEMTMKREVWCPKCDIYHITIEANPKCTTCKSTLITVLYSKMTGERIIKE